MRSTLCVALGLLVACLAVFVAQNPPAGQDAAGARGAAGRGGRGGQPGPAPRVITFEARPSSIRPGEPTVLVWQTENPAGLTIEPAIGPVTPRGSKQLTPSATTTYTLTMRGPNNTPITSSVT